MKNISRRVFIKGMAVAAVATAASTVLTGCKLPTVDEPVAEAPVSSKVMTFADPTNSNKTITLTFGDLVKGNASFDKDDADKAVVAVNIVNNLGQDVQFNGTMPTTNGEYYIVISTYRDGYKGMGSDVLQASSGITNSYTCTDGMTDMQKASLDLSDVTSSVTLKVSFRKVVDNDSSEAVDKEIDSKEITYTL